MLAEVHPGQPVTDEFALALAISALPGPSCTSRSRIKVEDDLMVAAGAVRHLRARQAARQLSARVRSQELARRGLRLAVPHHGHDFTRVDHGPRGLSLKTHQAVRANLHGPEVAELAPHERSVPFLSIRRSCPLTATVTATATAHGCHRRAAATSKIKWTR